MFKVKHQADISIKRFKACLIAQGFSQVHEIDFIEIFPPSIRQELLKIFLAITIMLEMILLQMDVISAYLESFLRQSNHLIYMKIPQRYKIDQQDLVCKIFKNLYRLKQARKFQNKILIKFFQKIKFVTTNADPCILAYQKGDIFIIVEIYVNDLVLASQSQDGLNRLKDQLIQEFNMKD